MRPDIFRNFQEKGIRSEDWRKCPFCLGSIKTLMNINHSSHRRQRRTLQDLIVILMIAIPVYVAASIYDVFETLMAWTRRHNLLVHEWISILILLGFASAIFSIRRWIELKDENAERKKAEEALKYRGEFESLIVTISNNFINLGPDQIDQGIHQALDLIGRFASVDRSYVFLFSENGKRMDNTHEWCALGVTPQIERLKRIRVDEALPWFAAIIKRQEVLHVPRVLDLPPEARAEKEEFQLEGIQSLLVVPMVYGSSLVGFLGFDSVRAEKHWTEEIVTLLKIAGEIFTNALEHKRVEEELRKSRGSAQRLARENAIVAEIGRIISSTLDIEAVYDRFAKELRNLISFDRIVIDLIHPEKNTFTIAYVAGAEILGRRAGDVFSLSGSDNEYLIGSRSGLLIQPKEESELARLYPVLLTTFRAGFLSMMSVPLVANDQVIGGLHFRSFQREAYTDFDLKLAERVGTQIAGAIANAKLFTEHKQTEEDLSIERQRFQSLAEDAPFGMVLIDSQDRFVYVNPKFKQLFGYILKEVPNGKTWFRKAFPDRDYRHQVIATWIQDLHHFNPTTPRPRTFNVACKDGTEKIINFISVQLATAENLVTCEDVTQHRHAEDALKESETRYHSLFDGVPVGLYRSGPDGKLIDANLTLIQMLGYPDRETFLKVKTDESYVRSEDQIQWKNLLDREGILHHFEMQLWRRDGTPIWVEENARAYRGPGGQILYYEGSIQDINEKKLAAAEMLSLQEQLRQSQKMEAVGRLAGGIAHDFNNLLTVISGYSQLSLNTLQERDPLRENISEIQRATDRAASLTRQLLAFSRRQILDMRLIDLNLIVQDLDKMLRRVIGEDIELATFLDKNLWTVNSDPGQIEQVILNLAVNARDAMPKGGRLTIETANIELDQEYVRAYIGVKPGPCVKLSIKDTGVGMSHEVMERAFEPFFTTKEKGRGTGLGLSTVYGIVKQSGGDVWVQSEVGKGTLFEIYLPKAEETRDAFKPEVPPPLRLQGSETILLVEDEEAVRVLTSKTLRNYGYQVLEAANGEQVIRIVENGHRKIHLLVTDVVMPGMSGREVAERIFPLYPELKVLYISGYTDSAIVHHGILVPGTALLLKPFKPEALARKVREILDQTSTPA
jgi:PAS domain S-box-containing protein